VFSLGIYVCEPARMETAQTQRTAGSGVAFTLATGHPVAGAHPRWHCRQPLRHAIDAWQYLLLLDTSAKVRSPRGGAHYCRLHCRGKVALVTAEVCQKRPSSLATSAQALHKRTRAAAAARRLPARSNLKIVQPPQMFRPLVEGPNSLAAIDGAVLSPASPWPHTAARWRRYRADADGRSSARDPRSSPSTARSSPPCAPRRTAP
jgi:hypothetical protein